MQFDVLTLFPEMFVGPLSESILKRAQKIDAIKINLHDLRNWATDTHKTVDDRPYGGGLGMVMKVDVMDRAIQEVRSRASGVGRRTRTILLTPSKNKFNQDKAVELAQKYDNIILICGHYEGFDARIREHLVDEEISIGDFVLTGGELPAMVIIDAVSRLIPNVLKDGSAADESYMEKDENGNYIMEYPQYTRPEEYKGWKVPEVLLSGNHAEIKKWRKSQR